MTTTAPSTLKTLTPFPSPPLLLTCHPTSPGTGGNGVTVDFGAVSGEEVGLLFRISAMSSGLVIPPLEAAVDAPVDGLWQHTCCEVFLARLGQPSYREFNFSPSGQWAAYAFSDTRQRDPAAEGDWRRRPDFVTTVSATGFELQVTLRTLHLPPGEGPLCVGLSAVLEAAPGSSGAPLSYWALRHPAAVPDFHHRGAFALCLTP